MTFVAVDPSKVGSVRAAYSYAPRLQLPFNSSLMVFRPVVPASPPKTTGQLWPRRQ